MVDQWITMDHIITGVSNVHWRVQNKGHCSRLAQTVTDYADASHSESAKSNTTTVLYGIFSSENSYPCTVTNKVPFYGNLPIKHEKATFQAAFPHFIWSLFDFYVLWPP